MNRSIRVVLAMPIKFRCEYCRQLMGIAENKAGSQVDCPTCGRALRVPTRPGTVEPPPAKPTIDLADNDLRRALDELAHIGHAEKIEVPPEPHPTPAARPQVIQVRGDCQVREGGQVRDAGQVSDSGQLPGTNPPKPSTDLVPQRANIDIVALEPLPRMKVVDPPANPQVAAAEPPAPLAPSTIAEVSFNEVLGGLARESLPGRVSSSSPKTGPAIGTAASTPARRGTPFWGVILVAIVCLLVGAVAGVAAARYLFNTRVNPAGVEDESAAMSKSVEPVDAQPVIHGRLTFRDAQRQRQPDSGAVVLLLPVKKMGQKLDHTGLRPNDDEESRTAAAQRVARLGGRFIRTDDDGRFQVDLPAGNDFVLLVLSHFRGRSVTDEASDALLNQLEVYFERPDQLVGKLAFHLERIRRSDTESVNWDHTFGE